MNLFNFELLQNPFFYLPFHSSGWGGWLVLGLSLLLSARGIWGSSNFRRPLRWKIFLASLALVPLAILLIEFRPTLLQSAAIPNLPLEVNRTGVLVFLAFPIFMAAGLAGALPALFTGLFTGLFLGLFVTHDLFSIIEWGFLGLFIGVALSQNYRTPFYKVVRHPLGGAITVWIAFLPLFLLISFFSIPGSLAERLDFTLVQNWQHYLIRGIELGLAGLFFEVFYLFLPAVWRKPVQLIASPSEVSLQARFLLFTLPLAVLLFVILILADWWVAGRAARQMMESRLEGLTRVASETLPYFLEAGQSLIIDMAQPELVQNPPSESQLLLMESIRAVPYFRQLVVVNAQRQPLTSYPPISSEDFNFSPDEEVGIGLALKGVVVQVYPLSPSPGEKSAQVSFIAAIKDEAGDVLGAVLGRTDFESNPFTQPALSALEGVLENGGEGFILDEQGYILYQTSIATPLTAPEQFVGRLEAGRGLYEDTSPTGTRLLVLVQQVTGRPWQIVARVPASVAQQIALNIAVPTLVVLLILFGAGSVLVFGIVRLVTHNLLKLTDQAVRISHGELDHTIESKGSDEIGRLAKAFETMRLSLKKRLEELNQLLVVSQGVAANLEISEAIQPILKAALDDECVSARVVLIQEVQIGMEGDQLVGWGAGKQPDLYQHLDGQIFEQMRSHHLLSIPNTSRVRRISAVNGKPHPAALIAFGLFFETTYYGAFWLAYDKPRNFTEDEVRFLNTLASEAALAAANSRLYASAEIGRRRLEAVLASVPEPVLVFDEKDRLLLLNPAAMHIPGLISAALPGRPLQEVVTSENLIKLISGSLEDRIASREIQLSNGKVFYASVAPVMGEDYQVGKVCVLRDITHYKELDTLKSEIVATVSHDLRTPLTLLRGYSSMLSMIGELNEQQQVYVNKIVSTVEDMTHLVNNLLDLSRIESGIPLKLEELDPMIVVEKIIRQYQAHASQKNIQLTFEGPADGKRLLIKADLALLQQALINLVDNAIKYTRKDGQVVVRVRAGNERLTFEVHDNGIGIAPLDLPRLFEKFYRSGRREAYEKRGSGLGLAIVKSIAERHHGRVWVDSQLGKGSTFYMELPTDQPQVMPEEDIREGGVANLKK
ncbi:ATP-binding protein [Bellilinea sp.]